MDYHNFLINSAEILLAIGGLAWGLVGLLGLNPVAKIFGEASLLTRIIYILVGASAVYLILLHAGVFMPPVHEGLSIRINAG